MKSNDCLQASKPRRYLNKNIWKLDIFERCSLQIIGPWVLAQRNEIHCIAEPTLLSVSYSFYSIAVYRIWQRKYRFKMEPQQNLRIFVGTDVAVVLNKVENPCQLGVVLQKLFAFGHLHLT